ncbi:MAG TPA: RodZ domain-containing protein [Vicinamibacterales bacterium]
MDIGETLRIAREQRGLSLDGLSQRTKIGAVALRAIEENDIQKLPGGIFLRGFLRAYAREVGLDVEDTVSRYIAQFEPQDEVLEEGAVDQSGTKARAEDSAPALNEEPLREMSMQGLIAIIVFALGVLAYMTLRQPPSTSQTASSERPAASPVVLASTRSEAGTTGSQEPVAPAPAVNTVSLTIQTVGPCWVSATVDGLTAIYRLMGAGERQTIEGANDVVLRVGDPATFTFLINGAAGKSLGPPGTVATVHITADNYREFVATETTP